MKIYLASPFFNSEELEYYTFAIRALRAAGHEVYVPQEHEVENAWSLPNYIWASKVFIEDIRAIEEAEVVMVLNWGMYSDSGTAWEAGYAYALKKQVIQVLCGKENATYSLMTICGCNKTVDIFNIGSLEESCAYLPVSKIIQK